MKKIKPPFKSKVFSTPYEVLLSKYVTNLKSRFKNYDLKK